MAKLAATPEVLAIGLTNGDLPLWALPANAIRMSRFMAGQSVDRD
ncbi:hypothetical protein [Microbulbifer elongatus]|nr:hypothetical protein [Microbulbifer elongatus]